MKKTLMLITLALISTLTQGQNNKVKEYGIGLYSLDNFSLQYRWGTDKKLYRISGDLNVSSSADNFYQTSLNRDTNIRNTQNNTTVTKEPVRVGFGLGFSILNLKPINDNFGIVVGPSVATTFSYGSNTSDKNLISNQSNSTVITNLYEERKGYTISPNIGLVIGCYYSINSKFFIYGEIKPNFYVAYTKEEMTGITTSNYPNQPSQISEYNSNNDRTNYGIASLSNSNALLTFAYRISK